MERHFNASARLPGISVSLKRFGVGVVETPSVSFIQKLHESINMAGFEDRMGFWRAWLIKEML
jgi:hypothetical protein